MNHYCQTVKTVILSTLSKWNYHSHNFQHHFLVSQFCHVLMWTPWRNSYLYILYSSFFTEEAWVNFPVHENENTHVLCVSLCTAESRMLNQTEKRFVCHSLGVASVLDRLVDGAGRRDLLELVWRNVRLKPRLLKWHIPVSPSAALHQVKLTFGLGQSLFPEKKKHKSIIICMFCKFTINSEVCLSVLFKYYTENHP